MAYKIIVKGFPKKTYKVDAMNREQALHFFEENNLIIGHIPEREKKGSSRKTYDLYLNNEYHLNFESKEDAESWLKETKKRPDTMAGNPSNVWEIKSKDSRNYKIGDHWRNDFDYTGMIEQGSKAEITWGEKKLNKLFDSYEDVNYHKESEPLYEAIQELKAGNKEKAEEKLAKFRQINKDLL